MINKCKDSLTEKIHIFLFNSFYTLLTCNKKDKLLFMNNTIFPTSAMFVHRAQSGIFIVLYFIVLHNYFHKYP